jgi:hypothetical protein
MWRVMPPDVPGATSHHDVVIAAPRAVLVEIGRAYLALDQVFAGRAVLLDVAGGRDVVGGDAVADLN